VEDAADLAGMFDVAEHGTAATWQASVGGASVDLAVMWLRPEDDFGGGDIPANIAIATRVRLPAASLPVRPARNNLLTVAGISYRVADVRQDDDGALFTLHLRRP
jgi:hypothetical protein